MSASSQNSARVIGTEDTSFEPAGGKRLIGWLISFSQDELGVAYELRSGRILISADELPNQAVIVVEGDDVSLPHAALNATLNHKLTVLDIFSETGTFIQRSGGKKEEKVSGAARLEHGDWIRIGENTRFQVCLINGPGNKN